MKLLVGLGNPGPRYETTRHNAGFLMLELLAEEAGSVWSSASQKFHGELLKARLLGEDCLFLKPMTFMNKSGLSVGEAMRFFKIPSRDMVVLHDEIDMPAGKVKTREGGGHGGHNGIRNIIAVTGERDFHRMKLGVGRPSPDSPIDVSQWVLSPFSDEELLQLQQGMLQDVKIRLKGIFEKDAVKE